VSPHQVTALLDVSFIEKDGKTLLVHQRQKTPLKVTKTHSLTDGRLSITLMDCSPGMLSGDRYQVSFVVGQGCRVFANNQSFTRVHPSRMNECSVLKQQLSIESDAFLEYAMEPTMLFRDADLQSVTEIKMSVGSTLLYHDVLCPGRTSRGEIFHYRRYSGKMRVWMADELIYANHLCVDPNIHPVQSIGLWGKYTHLGNLFVFSERVNEQILTQVIENLAAYDHITHTRSGASLTYKHGLMITVLAEHAWHITELFAQLAKLIKDRLNVS
jgi:urease accessory protein